MKKIVDNRYRLQQLLGKGTYGAVYSAIDMITNLKVAIKIEFLKKAPSFLQREIIVLEKLQGEEGFTKLYSNGESEDQRYIVIEQLGENIYEVFKYLNKQLSLKEVIFLGEEMLKRIITLHTHNFIHRDIKPHQFIRNKKKIFLVDFGLSASYILPTSVHIPFCTKKEFIGNAMFASRNAHSKVTLSRRDDLESWIYVVIYLLTGSLPWVNNQTEKMTASEILLRKNIFNSSKVFEQQSKEFFRIFTYIRKLGFMETPDYKYIFHRLSKIKIDPSAQFFRVFNKFKIEDSFTCENSIKKVSSYIDRTEIIKGRKKKRNSKRKQKSILSQATSKCYASTEECKDLPEFKNRMILKLFDNIGTSKGESIQA